MGTENDTETSERSETCENAETMKQTSERYGIIYLYCLIGSSFVHIYPECLFVGCHHYQEYAVCMDVYGWMFIVRFKANQHLF